MDGNNELSRKVIMKKVWKSTSAFICAYLVFTSNAFKTFFSTEITVDFKVDCKV